MKKPSHKGQDAMEFLISYGWAFLLIAIIVGILVYYVVLPRNISPNTCSFVTGIICNDLTISVNSVTKLMTIYVNLTNNEPNNVANVLIFVNMNGQNTTPISCITNSTIIPGGSILCAANTLLKGSISQFYSGALYLNLTDCGLNSNYTYTHSCSKAPRQTIKGGFSGHGETTVPAVFQTRTPLADLFCVGSTQSPSNQVYFAPILSGNAIGQWATTNSYPLANMQYAGCAINGGYIYCVGGTGSSNSVYYATANSLGIGAWIKTTNYPVSITEAGCAFSGSVLDCVGSNATGATSSTYYGTASSSGVSSWTAGTAYPTSFYNSGCVVNTGTIYCMGGQSNPYAIYTSALSGGVFGSWSLSNTLTNGTLGSSCVAYSGYIYCIGGSINPDSSYYANVVGTAIGPWTQTTQYPTALTNAGCTAVDGYLYCVGSSTSKATFSFYAPISANGIGTWKSGTPYPLPLANAYCVSTASSTAGSTGGYLS